MVETPEKGREGLHKLVDSLPRERLPDAEALLTHLNGEPRVQVKQGHYNVKLGGLWAGLGIEISEDDIDEARREMWGT